MYRVSWKIVFSGRSDPEYYIGWCGPITRGVKTILLSFFLILIHTRLCTNPPWCMWIRLQIRNVEKKNVVFLIHLILKGFYFLFLKINFFFLVPTKKESVHFFDSFHSRFRLFFNDLIIHFEIECKNCVSRYTLNLIYRHKIYNPKFHQFCVYKPYNY